MNDPELLCTGCMEERGGAAVCARCGWREAAAPESPHYLPPRTVLKEQYMIGRVLGHGGFAITYLAWDLNLTRKLALKEFFPTGIVTRAPGDSSVTAYTGQSRGDFEYGLEKFLEEARVLARFQNHPGIISVLNFFRANGTAYLVMEYLDGRTLKDYLAAQGEKITYRSAVELLMPVMDALREVHHAGVLHRDISPDNIYITQSGQVKLLDFGAARFALNDRSQNLSVILKTGYAPEEQYRSKGRQGPWTDVYGVGATIYRAITGEVPPPAPDRLAEDEIVPPSHHGTLIDPSAEAALMKALAVRSADRYQSMEDFQKALMAAPSAVTRTGTHAAVDGPTRIIHRTNTDDGSTDIPEPHPDPAGWQEFLRKNLRALAAGAAAVGLLVLLAIAFRDGDTTSSQEQPHTPVAQAPGTEAEKVPRQPPGDNRQPAPPQGREPERKPLPARAGTQDPALGSATNVALAGKWQSQLSDGRRAWTCVSENSPDGEYRFSSSCPPPFANERGRIDVAPDGTWKLTSYSGRTDHGTYRVISHDHVEFTGQLGTVLWRRQAAGSRPGPGPQEPSPRSASRSARTQSPRDAYLEPQERDRQRQQAHRQAEMEAELQRQQSRQRVDVEAELQRQQARRQAEVEAELQRIQAQRRAEVEQRRQQERDERLRQAELEQRRRQEQLAEREAQRQREQLINEGSRMIQDLFRR